VRVVRLGLVSEHEGNSSPGLCLTRLFEVLLTDQHLHVQPGARALLGTKRPHRAALTDRNPRAPQATLNPDHGHGEGAPAPEAPAPAVIIELVFFCRVDPVTVFSEVMQRVAAKVVFIDHRDLAGAQTAIAEEKLDVLLFIALPTEKFTVFLSAARLAPVQVGAPI